MDNRTDARRPDRSDWQAYDAPRPGWQDTVDLLRLVQGDYAGARQQLQRVSQTLADSEALLNERLHYALLRSTGHDTMCLIPYRSGAMASSLGRATLGFPAPLKQVPHRPRLEVRCLGGFELSWDGSPITRWRSVKAKTLLEYMMTRPREPVVKDVLMEALWPDCDSQSANNNLKAAVHSLRQTLAGAPSNGEAATLVLFVQGSYVLSRDVEIWLDVEEFSQHWLAGLRLEKEGRTGEAIREFELAQALYRGDYLQDEPYEEWTLLPREALRDNYLAVLSKLAEHAIDEGDYQGCIIYCQKILGQDSCREDAYRWLMRSHSRLGQRNRALRWFEICRRATKAGLETEPDQESQDLHRRLMRNEPV